VRCPFRFKWSLCPEDQRMHRRTARTRDCTRDCRHLRSLVSSIATTTISSLGRPQDWARPSMSSHWTLIVRGYKLRYLIFLIKHWWFSGKIGRCHERPSNCLYDSASPGFDSRPMHDLRLNGEQPFVLLLLSAVQMDAYKTKPRARGWSR